MSSVVRKKAEGKPRPKRKRERTKTKKCSLLPAHAFNPNANQSRITQKKGLYAFGKTSLRVSRDVYFKQTEESAARANEDLHKIIDLSNCDQKSVKRAEHYVMEEAIVPIKMTSRKPSEAESISKDSRQSTSHLSETLLKSVTMGNSTKKTRKRCRQDKPCSSSFQAESSIICDQVDMISDATSPTCIQALPPASPASTIDLPSCVWEDVTKDLLATISIKLGDLRRNKDGTNGDLYFRQIRHNLQRVHRQRFKASVISKLVSNESFGGAPSNHTVHPNADTMNYSVGDIRPPISPPVSPPSCDPVDHRVKIPSPLSRPFSVAYCYHHNVENRLFPVADFSAKCDCRNNLPRTDPFSSFDGPTAKRRQLYPASPIPIFFSQPVQDSIGLDILDYADSSAARSSIFPVQENLANVSPEHSNNDNATWRSLPVVSPIKLSPYFNPTPRFYRRKLY